MQDSSVLTVKPGVDGARPDAGHCFHCGATLGGGARRQVSVDGAPRSVCSARCAEVCEAIDAAGLTRFYRERRERRHEPAHVDDDVAANFDIYDRPAFQRRFVRRDADAGVAITLLLDGLRCAACTRLVEARLRGLDGVESVLVNATTHRADIVYDEERVRLSDILGAVYALGYAAFPYDPDHRRERLARERRDLLQRLALGALFAMQIMMLSFALYAGEWFGIEPRMRHFLQWVTFVLVLPVIGYSAWPFFRGAARAIANRHLTMEVPVALALAIAFTASAGATISGHGAVYFESIAMFTTLLLASRYFELRARVRATAAFDQLARVMPQFARRLDAAGRPVDVAVADLEPDDVILVRAGSRIPVDGVVIDGDSAVDEAVVSGESRPLAKRVRDAVIGGTMNLDSPLKVRVTRAARESFVAEVSRIAESAHAYKPRLAILADRIAGKFVFGVLLVALACAVFWFPIDPGRAVSATIAVLVISCPCALALATPAALTAASAAMLGNGAAMRNAEVIESFARATAFVFDKTGTLTTGELVLEDIDCRRGAPGDALAIAATLGEQSDHSVSRALVRAARGRPLATAMNVRNVTGGGLSGTIAGTRYWLGSRRFVGAAVGDGDALARLDAAPDGDKRAFLADAGGVIAGFRLRDELRSGAQELVRILEHDGCRTAILSGDRAASAATIARRVGITDVVADSRPAEKLAAVSARHDRGDVTVVVGDGVNDAPMLAQAYTAVAVDGACDLARQQADLVLLRDDLYPLAAAYRISRRTLRVVRQNITWAIAYNVVAIPLAAAGYAPPWIAAAGMSLSSLVVVLNATRIGR